MLMFDNIRLMKEVEIALHENKLDDNFINDCILDHMDKNINRKDKSSEFITSYKLENKIYGYKEIIIATNYVVFNTDIIVSF